MNTVDVFIVLIFILYVLFDYRRGFLRLCADLLGLIISFFFALGFYDNLATVFTNHTNISVINAKPLSFLIIWIIGQTIFYFLSKIISYYTPVSIKDSAINRYLGIIPAAIKGIVFIAVLLTLILILPLNQKTKLLLSDSLLGKATLKYTVSAEAKIEAIFGNSSTGALSYLTNQGSNDELTPLNFTTTQMNIDEKDENIMLAKINDERAKVGVKPLAIDILIRNVARAHSRDMLIQGYFSHISKDGSTLSDRFLAAKVDFQIAGENLALAPNVDLAHVGLMNSPKHKANILDPTYTRVGIGIMDAGQYGIMVTQDFAN